MSSAERPQHLGDGWNSLTLVLLVLLAFPVSSLPNKVVQGDTALFPNGELFILQEKESPTLQQELMDTKQALAIANQDKEKLLQEVRKYNPLFEL